jgi:hypothetical protein
MRRRTHRTWRLAPSLALGLAACTHAPRTIDEARALDDEALAAAALRDGDVALVADGAVHRAASRADAIKLASAMTSPLHAYLATGGAAPEPRWEAVGLYEHPDVIGRKALVALAVAIDWSPSNGTLVFTREGRRFESHSDDGKPLVRLHVSPATDPRAACDVVFLVASGFDGGLFLSAATAQRLHLERSEEPGAMECAFLAEGRTLACRRGLVTVTIPELGIATVVSAATPREPPPR